ncbi:hypothetical protein [Enterococcus sp. AZ103]|uniref:hypothetical protein n=1 Tax=Enterococcus sp. AZ103 TaxID=2774628 RepID=UPI003F29BDEA
MERKTDKIIDYLRNHPVDTNIEIADALKFDKELVRKQISLFKARGWIQVTYENKVRTIIVKKEDPKSMVEYKKEIFTEMLPTLLSDFEETTSIQERNMVAKMIFRVLENL